MAILGPSSLLIRTHNLYLKNKNDGTSFFPSLNVSMKKKIYIFILFLSWEISRVVSMIFIENYKLGFQFFGLLRVQLMYLNVSLYLYYINKY